jgi:hypothetical protein
MVYSWTFITFFFKLSSWVYYLTIREIAAIFAYAMATDLIESLLILVGIVLLYLLVPARTIKDDFAVRGTWLAISCLALLMLYLIPLSSFDRELIDPVLWILITISISLLFTFFFSHLRLLRHFALLISERMVSFSILFTPLSVISMVVIVIRLIG